MERVGSYRDLIVWQRGLDLAEKAYRLTKSFPRDEQFGLSSQTRRAAASIPANIAEGYGRGTLAAYASFLRIARGSLRELETHLILAERIGIMPASDARELLTDCDEVGRLLHALLVKLRAAGPRA